MKRMVVNEILKRRTSPTGTALAFVPGQNFVYELNDTATSILDLLSEPKNSDELISMLTKEYEVTEEESFKEDVNLIIQRFCEHNIIVEAE